jgi:hypothetical protein
VRGKVVAIDLIADPERLATPETVVFGQGVRS